MYGLLNRDRLSQDRQCVGLHVGRAQFAVLVALVVGCASPARAEVIGFLSEPRAEELERFEADLYVVASADLLGNQIEWINLDIANSTVGGVPLSDYSRVVFQPASPFAAWFDGRQFGQSTGFESQVSLDAFAVPSAITYEITDVEPFLIGTFGFNYQGISVGPEHVVRLDVTGRDDGTSSRTSSIGMRSGGGDTAHVDLEFTSAFGAGHVTYPAITVIPEPSGVAVLALLVAGMLCFGGCGRRANRRAGSGGSASPCGDQESPISVTTTRREPPRSRCSHK